jgi:hypothetical protein
MECFGIQYAVHSRLDYKHVCYDTTRNPYLVKKAISQHVGGDYVELLICGGSVVTMSERGVVRDGAVLIEGDRVVEVGKCDDVRRRNPRGYEKLNAKDQI